MSWFGTLWRRLVAWCRRHSSAITVTVLLVLVFVVYLSPDIFIAIGAGEAGVLWKRFGGGTQTGRFYAEGQRAIWPWDRMTVYNLRLQQVSHVYDVLTSDGLDVKAEITIRWKPVPADLGKLHRDVGPDYVQTLIIPTIGAYAREEIAHYSAEQLYSKNRLDMQRDILARTKMSYVVVNDVLIRSVVLPPPVRAAIEAKVAQAHLVEREMQEAKRKAIEATGIRNFQVAVGSNLSEGYLRLRSIEAMLELAKSANAKIVVVGSGKDGIPLLLGGLEPQGAAAPRAHQ